MAITSIKKGLIGAKDINWDLDGSNSQFSKETSQGSVRTDFLINASWVPVSSTVRAKKFADQVTALTKEDFDVDAVLEQILDNLENIGLPDTTNFFAIAGSGGALTIAAGKITDTELAANAVTTTKINADAVTSDKIADGAIDTAAQIANDLIDSQHYAATSIDHEHYALNSVGPENLDMDNSGNQPFMYPVWGAVDHVPGVTTSSFTISTAGSPKTVTTSMSANVWFGNVNTGGLSIEQSYVSGTNTITVVCTGAINALDSFSYVVWDTVVDKT